MRAVVQRVTRAKVTIDEETVGEIGIGLVVLLGIALDDTETDADYLAPKIVALRIFDDLAGRMNVSLKDCFGGLLIVSSSHSMEMFDVASDLRGVTQLRLN